MVLFQLSPSLVFRIEPMTVKPASNVDASPITLQARKAKEHTN